tara:strand:- start:867 stop:1301 length:435 start_codon:yes stop_codon:yes gene_type:complete
MILIAHRGNIEGENLQYENAPKYCEDAIAKGYNVEIDIRWNQETFWSGHDGPQYRINSDFLKKKEVWCHAKDIRSLRELQKIGVHCFFHNKDDVVLTSKGYIWTFPTYELTDNSICVLPEVQNINNINKCAGICSDFIAKFAQV